MRRQIICDLLNFSNIVTSVYFTGPWEIYLSYGSTLIFKITSKTKLNLPNRT